MAQQEPKVLSFDVVGTLIDFEGGILRYLRGAVTEIAKHDDEFDPGGVPHVAGQRVVRPLSG